MCEDACVRCRCSVFPSSFFVTFSTIGLYLRTRKRVFAIGLISLAYIQPSRWWKNVWNLPFSGISVSMGGITIDRIVNDPSLRRLACEVMDETIAIANADLRKHGCTEDELLGEETVSVQILIVIYFKRQSLLYLKLVSFAIPRHTYLSFIAER